MPSLEPASEAGVTVWSLLQDSPIATDDLWATADWLAAVEAGRQYLAADPTSQPPSGEPLSEPLSGPLSDPLSGPLSDPLSGPLSDPLSGPLSGLLSGLVSDPVQSSAAGDGPQYGSLEDALRRLAPTTYLQPRAVLLQLLVGAARGGRPPLADHRELAAVLEQFHTAGLLHRSLETLPADSRRTARLLVLAGDLLVTAGLGRLARLRCSAVYQLLAGTLSAKAHGALLGRMDAAGRQLPCTGFGPRQWRRKQLLLRGQLLADGFRAALVLCHRVDSPPPSSSGGTGREPLQSAAAERLGRSVALAWQARSDIGNLCSERPLDLTSLPVTRHLQGEPVWLRRCQTGLSASEEDRLRQAVQVGPALTATRRDLRRLVTRARQALSVFPDCEPRHLLDDVIGGFSFTG